MNEINMFSIKDIENLSGIKAHTIRIWEQRYSFLKPQRTNTNIRYYTNTELKIILNISLLNKYGYKISHINRMQPSAIEEKVLSLTQSAASQERLINELIQNMIDLYIDGFEKTIDNYIHSKGIEKTILHIIFPFLERIGVLWTTNHINPGQEHLVSNIIRQKIIIGIENAKSYVRVDKKILLFLPENEYHELSLLFVHYLLKSHGTKVIYAGAGVPLKDLEFLCMKINPDFIYTHLTSVTNNFNIEKLFAFKHRSIKAPLIISGRIASTYKKSLPEAIVLKKSFGEIIEFINSL